MQFCRDRRAFRTVDPFYFEDACEDFHKLSDSPAEAACRATIAVSRNKAVRGIMEFAKLSDDFVDKVDDLRPEVTIEDVRQALQAEVLCCHEKLSSTVRSACGCDLMSDVLAFTRPGSVLLTGLTNGQVIRTAEILDLKAIVFVRDKKPDEKTILLAQEYGIPLLTSPFPLYESCGVLFARGLGGCTDLG